MNDSGKTDEESKSEWKEIGTIYIDSGCVIIGDPMAILSDNQYQEWCKRQEELKFPLFDKIETIEDTTNKPRNFITSETGFGDGSYHVFAKVTDFGKNHGKRVTEIRIVFDVTYGFDDESKQMHDISMKELYDKVSETQRKM
ncbi:MAG: hypothetical protein ACREBB_03970 [Nitrosotalea sp.]